MYVPSHFAETDASVLHAQAIVGVEIPIDKLVGKWKVSQNRSEADELGVVAGLLGNGGRRQREMAELVREGLGPSRQETP